MALASPPHTTSGFSAWGCGPWRCVRYREVCKEVHTLYCKFFLKKYLFATTSPLLLIFYIWEIHRKLQSSIEIPGTLHPVFLNGNTWHSYKQSESRN